MEKQYHIALSKEDLKGAKFAILPGDPGRVPIIAKQINPDAQLLADNREFKTFGTSIEIAKYHLPIIVTSTGIGCPSAAIAIEELAKLGVTHFFRVGTAGSLQKHVKLGDIVISTGSVREEGTSRQYVPIEFPAVANYDMIAALRMAAKSLGIEGVHVGISHTKDAFYAEDLLDPNIPLHNENKARWNTWIKAGVLATAMEASALYIIASFRGLKCAELLVPIGLTYDDQPLADPDELHRAKEKGVENMTRMVVGAIKLLVCWRLDPSSCPFV